MRPVNLIPPEERRGSSAPLRTGPLPYVVLGALVVALAGVVALVLAGNQVGEREAEVAKLEREDARAATKAQRLAAYTEFRSMSEQRVATVSELADSRFDWERVMHELSLILPSDVWLVSLTASAASGAGVEGDGGASGMRSAIPGPALELSGCADGQEAVAGFVTALEDIDGVTRVGVQSSELPQKDDSDSGGGGGGDSAGDECRTRESIAKFGIVVAFDAAPVAAPATAEGAPPVSGESGETESASAEGEEG